MTGHTADDQAETVLLNLLRGAALDGLAGMDPGRRPLRRLRRAETRALCAELDLTPVADPSNDDPAFRRNRVRHELLPLLAPEGSVVLDLGLPDVDGQQVLRMLRGVSRVPVVVATARDDETEIVAVLDAGADDYVVKPFSAAQLDARIRAVLRRGGEHPVDSAVVVGGLRLDGGAPWRGGDAAALRGVVLAPLAPHREHAVRQHGVRPDSRGGHRGR